MNGIKKKLEQINGRKPTKAEFNEVRRNVRKEAKRLLATPGIMDTPAKWSFFRTIKEICKSVSYVLKVRKNQRRVYRQMARNLSAAIKRHGGAA